MSHANPVRYYPQGNKRFQQLSFERSVGNQTQMFYRNSNDQPNFRHGRSYNRNNHGTNNTLGGYNGKQYNCHYHNTKPSKQLFNYRREHQESLDGKLFRAIKEYANNLYSLFLMEMDVKLHCTTNFNFLSVTRTFFTVPGYFDGADHESDNHFQKLALVF
jgi:hypothetical protein